MESQTIKELEALTPTEMDAGLVFSGVPTGNRIWGYQNPCLYTPAIDPHYSFHESARDAAVWFITNLIRCISTVLQVRERRASSNSLPHV